MGDVLMIVSNVKAKGGFVLINTITKEVIKEGSFMELSLSRSSLINLGYGTRITHDYAKPFIIDIYTDC